MNKTVKEKTEPSAGLYPIRTVSELTGVNAITLRAWESRYALVEPVRKESGHRLYTQENIDLINRVVGLLDRGMRIGQVKSFLESREAGEPSGETKDSITSNWRRYIDSMLAAIIRFDEAALDAVYSEALSHFEVRTVSRRLLEPLLVEIGSRWESNLGSIAEEHFFGFFLRNKLGARFHHRVRNQGGPRLVMACLPGERHEIGLLLFALAANGEGYDPVVLGADMPLKEIAPAVSKTGAVAVVLSASVKPVTGIMEHDLPSLAGEAGVPVCVGGKISIDMLDDLRRAGLHPLGVDIDTGLKHLADIISA